MACTANVMNVQEQLKSSARDMTEVGSLLGGESFSTEASFWKALSSQAVGGELNTVHRFSIQ